MFQVIENKDRLETNDLNTFCNSIIQVLSQSDNRAVYVFVHSDEPRQVSNGRFYKCLFYFNQRFTDFNGQFRRGAKYVSYYTEQDIRVSLTAKEFLDNNLIELQIRLEDIEPVDSGLFGYITAQHLGKGLAVRY